MIELKQYNMMQKQNIQANTGHFIDLINHTCYDILLARIDMDTIIHESARAMYDNINVRGQFNV